MIVLVDTSDPLSKCEEELGLPVGQLMTPLTGFRNRAVEEGRRWAMDNGAYAGFDAEKLHARLRREQAHKKTCIFVAAPDVVGSARRTLEVFEFWWPYLESQKWPVALVAQDGQEHLPIPWDRLKAIFIGGSTGWKVGREAKAIILAAKAMGVWTHVGRVNTPERIQDFQELGVDSIDGTGISRYSHMRIAIRDGQPKLFPLEVADAG